MRSCPSPGRRSPSSDRGLQKRAGGPGSALGSGAAAPAVVQPLAPAEGDGDDEDDGPGEPDGSTRGAESDGSAEPAEGAEEEGSVEPDGGSPAGSEEKRGAAK